LEVLRFYLPSIYDFVYRPPHFLSPKLNKTAHGLWVLDRLHGTCIGDSLILFNNNLCFRTEFRTVTRGERPSKVEINGVLPHTPSWRVSLVWSPLFGHSVLKVNSSFASWIMHISFKANSAACLFVYIYMYLWESYSYEYRTAEKKI